jgi:TorA maturation chaperone TorD
MKKSNNSINFADAAQERSNIYGLLSIIYRQEPTSALLQQMKSPVFREGLASAGLNLEEELLNQPEEKLLEDLAVEYTRLFLGPGQHISPHESVHHEIDGGDWGRLWGKSTVEVKKFIETAGLEYTSAYTGLPDHICVELEFMQEVIKRELQAWKEKDREGAIYCLKIEKKFIEEHMARWVPGFCDKIIEYAELSFYREMAKLTKSFMENEHREIGIYLSKAEKIK